jgi:glutathione S-transferase
MMLEVYQFSVSPYAWRVLLALEIKRLPYELKLLQFSRQEYKSQEFLQFNPRGQIPVLKDGDYVIYESLAILFYLDRGYGEPPLFGKTPLEAGTIMRSVCETSAYLEGPLLKVVNPLCAHDPNDQLDMNQQAVSKLQEELRRVNATLTYSKWLAGNTFSAADIMLFPFIQLLLWALARLY